MGRDGTGLDGVDRIASLGQNTSQKENSKKGSRERGIREGQKERGIRALLMIVTYTAVWLSLATRHDVTPG